MVLSTPIRDSSRYDKIPEENIIPFIFNAIPKIFSAAAASVSAETKRWPSRNRDYTISSCSIARLTLLCVSALITSIAFNGTHDGLVSHDSAKRSE